MHGHTSGEVNYSYSLNTFLRNEFLSDTLYYRLSAALYVRMLANVAHGNCWFRDYNFRGWRMCLDKTNPYNDLPLYTYVSEHTGSSGNTPSDLHFEVAL
jgi:hypothetical protein